MNWYQRLKYAQIWDFDNSEDVVENLSAIYELEWKLHALKNYDFKGLPQRRDNIITKLEENLDEAIEVVKEPILYTFRKWLDNHALLDPQTWAAQRTIGDYNDFNEYSIDIGEDEALKLVIEEYKRYQNGNQPWTPAWKSPNWDSAFSEMLRDAAQFEDQMPSLVKLKEMYAADQQERYGEELFSEGFEQFGEMYVGQPFESEEAAELWIEENSSNFDLADYIYDFGIEGFTQSLGYAGVSLQQFIQDLNQFLVFPLWYDYWGSQGIEETRENLQEIYDMLESANSLEENIAAINVALNAVHQTGDMLQHLENYSNIPSSEIKDILDNLSEGTNLPKWNKQLRQIGVKVPRKSYQPR